jgi:hypothetical protein
VDQSWFAKSFNYAATHWGAETIKRLIERFLPPGGAQSQDDLEATYFPTLYDALLVRRDAEGKTLADRWEAESWAGLNNDEKVMMSCRRHSVATVIEVQRALDKYTFECRDLIEPNSPPFPVATELELALPRFTKMLVWLARFPHFSRIGAAGFEVPDLVWTSWWEAIQQQIRTAQTERPDLTPRQYLAEHMAECSAFIGTLIQAARKRMFESLDAHQCVAEFGLASSLDEVRAVIESKPEFSPEQPEPTPGMEPALYLYRWLRKGESADADVPAVVQSAEPEGPVSSLGSLRLYKDRLVLETISKAKYAFTRGYLDKHLGTRLQFRRESVIDLAKQLLEREKVWPDAHEETPSDPEPDSVPPEVKRHAIEQAHKQHYDKLLDDPVPALGGQTPRAAAQDPAQRQKLVDWLKGHVHQVDAINRREGLNLNIDWVLDALGVPELK